MDSEVKKWCEQGDKTERFREQMDIQFTDGKSKEAGIHYERISAFFFVVLMRSREPLVGQLNKPLGHLSGLTHQYMTQILQSQDCHRAYT